MASRRLRFACGAAALLSSIAGLGACALLVGPPDGHRLFPGDDADNATMGTMDGTSDTNDAAEAAAPDAFPMESGAGPDVSRTPPADGEAPADADAMAEADALAISMTVLASAENDPQGIVWTSTGLYWANNGDSTIHRLAPGPSGAFAPIAGDAGEASVFATVPTTGSPPPSDLLADAAHLYAFVGVVGNGDSQMCTSFVTFLLNGDAAPAQACAYPNGVCTATVKRMALGGGSVYLSAQTGSCAATSPAYVVGETAPGSNGSTWTSYGPLASTPAAVAADASRIYYAVGNAIYSALVSSSFSATLIGVSTLGSTVNDIVVDSESVYWCDSSGYISAVAKDGSAPQRTLASGQVAPWRLAQDGTYVYWTNTGTQASDGTVAAAPKNGGATVVTLAVRRSHPWGISADGNGGVYWTEAGSGNVVASTAP